MDGSIMKKKTILVVLASGLGLALLIYASQLDEVEPHRAAPAAYALSTNATATNRLLVDFRDDATKEQIQAVQKKYALALKPNSRFSWARRLLGGGVVKAKAKALLQKLRAEPLVERAELDMTYSIPPLEALYTRLDHEGRDETQKKSFPNDPKFKYQWHLKQINAHGVWPKATGKGVIVAVIDTGVAYMDRGKFKRVPDLASTEFVAGYDFVHDTDTPLDDHGHGTHVAGTIAQSTNNGIGVAGTAYNARIMPLKVLSSRGFGNVADIAEAIRFAANNGAKVINMSLGGSGSSKIMAAAVKYARDKGVVVVCAAGNEGRNRVSYPAAYPGALAVAATQFDRSTTFYSNWGKEIDVAAPGGNTRVDQNGDGMPDGVLQNTILPGRPDKDDYLMFMGTSMASPHVAGVVALVMESGVTDPDAVEKVIKSTAVHPKDKKWDPHYGAGIVDVQAALSKSATAWGGYKLGLSLALGLLVMMRLRQRRVLGVRPGLGAAAGLVLGSSGLFFFSGLMQHLPGPLSGMLTQGIPAWDAALLGAETHANPLFYSMLLPLGLTISLYGIKRLRGLLFGLTMGVAGHLLFHSVFYTADVTWIPNVMGLDQIWLALNSTACALLGYIVAKK